MLKVSAHSDDFKWRYSTHTDDGFCHLENGKSAKCRSLVGQFGYFFFLVIALSIEHLLEHITPFSPEPVFFVKINGLLFFFCQKTSFFSMFFPSQSVKIDGS